MQTFRTARKLMQRSDGGLTEAGRRAGGPRRCNAADAPRKHEPM